MPFTPVISHLLQAAAYLGRAQTPRFTWTTAYWSVNEALIRWLLVFDKPRFIFPSYKRPYHHFSSEVTFKDSWNEFAWYWAYFAMVVYDLWKRYTTDSHCFVSVIIHAFKVEGHPDKIFPKARGFQQISCWWHFYRYLLSFYVLKVNNHSFIKTLLIPKRDIYLN